MEEIEGTEGTGDYFDDDEIDEAIFGATERGEGDDFGGATEDYNEPMIGDVNSFEDPKFFMIGLYVYPKIAQSVNQST